MNDDRRGYVAGVAAGAVAFVLAYVFVYALSIGVVEESLLTGLAEAFGDRGGSWQIVGWVLFNAQFVTTTITVDVPLLGGTSAVNFIAESDALSPVLYLIPPAVLVAAGLGTTRLDGATETGRAVRLGASTVAGYLPLALLGTVLFTVSAGETGGGGPTLLTAAVLAGVVYPAVFGSVGAVLGTRL